MLGMLAIVIEVFGLYLKGIMFNKFKFWFVVGKNDNYILSFHRTKEQAIKAKKGDKYLKVKKGWIFLYE